MARILTKPPELLSPYNHQQLDAPTEFARRRQLAYERALKAAAEALQRLRSGPCGSLQHAQPRPEPQRQVRE